MVNIYQYTVTPVGAWSTHRAHGARRSMTMTRLTSALAARAMHVASSMPSTTTASMEVSPTVTCRMMTRDKYECNCHTPQKRHRRQRCTSTCRCAKTCNCAPYITSQCTDVQQERARWPHVCTRCRQRTPVHFLERRLHARCDVQHAPDGLRLQGCSNALCVDHDPRCFDACGDRDASTRVMEQTYPVCILHRRVHGRTTPARGSSVWG